ncbi:XkdF-like putative serine protease domain-containing protein [Chitinophaga sp.]|uniref:XkdF-like putative serine protease domain-containing protein n=1 Tax=Chitinophaga sp. TaxID=1869181 RepID=UPI0031D93C72
MKKDLPVFELTISDNLSDDSEVNFVALVDRPAIQRDFLMFNQDMNEQDISFARQMIPHHQMAIDMANKEIVQGANAELKKMAQNIIDAQSLEIDILKQYLPKDTPVNMRVGFAVQDEEQHIVTGPAMIPDSLIYRNDTNGEYYVTFSTNTINKIAQRFFLNGYQGNINIMHKQADVVADSVFYESWLVDREKGKMPLKGFEDLPDGTWFLTAKINNEDTWQKIKTGEYKGFSVEGLFDYSPAGTFTPEQKTLNRIIDILNSINE